MLRKVSAVVATTALVSASDNVDASKMRAKMGLKQRAKLQGNGLQSLMKIISKVQSYKDTHDADCRKAEKDFQINKCKCDGQEDIIREIKDIEADVEMHQNEISTSDKQAKTAATQIAQSNTEVEGLTNEINELTALLTQKEEKCTGDQADLLEKVNGLSQALSALGYTEKDGSAGDAFLQVSLRTGAAGRAAMSTVDSTLRKLAAKSDSTDLSLLQQKVQEKVGSGATMSAESTDEVVGMLVSLRDTFADELKEKQEACANDRQAHVDAKDAKQGEVDRKRDSILKKTKYLGQMQTKKAEHERDLGTQNRLLADKREHSGMLADNCPKWIAAHAVETKECQQTSGDLAAFTQYLRDNVEKMNVGSDHSSTAAASFLQIQQTMREAIANKSAAKSSDKNAAFNNVVGKISTVIEDKQKALQEELTAITAKQQKCIADTQEAKSQLQAAQAALSEVSQDVKHAQEREENAESRLKKAEKALSEKRADRKTEVAEHTATMTDLKQSHADLTMATSFLVTVENKAQELFEKAGANNADTDAEDTKETLLQIENQSLEHNDETTAALVQLQMQSASQAENQELSRDAAGGAGIMTLIRKIKADFDSELATTTQELNDHQNTMTEAARTFTSAQKVLVADVATEKSNYNTRTSDHLESQSAQSEAAEDVQAAQEALANVKAGCGDDFPTEIRELKQAVDTLGNAKAVVAALAK